MLRRLAGLVLILLAVVLAVFAVSNRHGVRLDLWPLPWTLDVPLYALILLPLFFGLLAGLLIGSASRLRHRLERGQQQRRIESLQRQLDAASRPL